MLKVPANTKDRDAMLPMLTQQSVPGLFASNGHHATGWHPMLAVSGSIAATDTPTGRGW